jgi:hypothetical protein
MATILTSTGTQVSGRSFALVGSSNLTLISSTEVSVFPETGRDAILILGIGQETTVLTTLPFLVVSFVGFVPFCLLNEVQHHGIIYVPMGMPEYSRYGGMVLTN